MPNGPFPSSSRPRDLKTVSGGRDARTGLGYGVLDPKTQLPRQLGSEFPYYEKEDSGDDEDLGDDESSMAASSKYQDYRPSDFLSAAGNNPFYFAAGNTKLSDCFWNPGKVLKEIATFKDSMSPIPGLHNKPGPGLSNTGPSFPYPGGGGSNFKRTGSTQGWSHAPPQTWQQANDTAAEDESEQIFTLKDLSDKMLSDEGESLHREHT